MNNLNHYIKYQLDFQITQQIYCSKSAIALGANIIERHFTLNKRMEGPDHLLIGAKEFKDLVKCKKIKKFNYG